MHPWKIKIKILILKIQVFISIIFRVNIIEVKIESKKLTYKKSKKPHFQQIRISSKKNEKKFQSIVRNSKIQINKR